MQRPLRSRIHSGMCIFIKHKNNKKGYIKGSNEPLDNFEMKEHTTKELRRGALVKLDDDSMAVIRDNEPSVKRKVEINSSGRPQIVEIESYRIVSVSIKGKGWETITHSDKEMNRRILASQ